MSRWATLSPRRRRVTRLLARPLDWFVVPHQRVVSSVQAYHRLNPGAMADVVAAATNDGAAVATALSLFIAKPVHRRERPHGPRRRLRVD